MPGPAVVAASEPRRVSLLAAELVANRVRARPRLRLMLSTGGRASGMHAVLRAHAADGSLPAAGVTAIAPDDVAGAMTHPRAASAALEAELRGTGIATEERPADARTIDLAVLTIGGDGVATAAALPALRAAREVVVLAAGDDDGDALTALLAGGPANAALAGHPELTVICDAAAAARLAPRPDAASDRVVIVLGHREPGVSAEHRISAHSHARLFRAEEVCLEDPVRAAVLTGYTATGGLSEAEQLAREWTVPGVAALMEVAGRNTAENASRSLPLVLALGGIRRVALVTSPWHVRAPFFFAPYRRHGLRVEWRPSRPLRHWRHLLAEELRGAPATRRQRAAAMATVRLVAPDVTGDPAPVV